MKTNDLIGKIFEDPTGFYYISEVDGDQVTTIDVQPGVNMGKEYWEDLSTVVENLEENERDIDDIAYLMDDDIREDVHRDLAPCSDIEFLLEYAKRERAEREAEGKIIW